MLGREYPVTHNSLFRIWDFMFAACYDAEYNTSHYVFDDDIPPNVYSLLANARVCNYHKGSNIGKRASQQDRVTYVCTPLLGILGDFILAMLIQVRNKYFFFYFYPLKLFSLYFSLYLLKFRFANN